MDKATFKTAKAQFLENLLNNILSEVEYYEQRIHICFNGEKFYIYSTQSKNSFDRGVNYIASLDLEINEDLITYDDYFELLLDNNEDITDLIKSKNLDLEKIKDNLKKLMKDDEIEGYTIIEKLNETFPGFNKVYDEYEKKSYINYVIESMGYKGFSLGEYIEEAIEKVKNLTYEEAMRDM
ncbi:MAG: hypothetical protein PHI37_05265 [Candidatus Gracilibacteria bacterium]|nr:hypothetical protein [Candidatus Gracilibacteria bacterium]